MSVTLLIFTSISNHFLVNRRLLEYMECSPIHLGDNASRHSPIMLKLKVANIPRSAPVNMDKPRRPAWHKAGEEDINNYTQLLHDKLGRLDTPACLNCQDVHCQHENHSEVRDGHMLDILTAIIENSHSAIPMSGKPWTTLIKTVQSTRRYLVGKRISSLSGTHHSFGMLCGSQPQDPTMACCMTS